MTRMNQRRLRREEIYNKNERWGKKDEEKEL